MKKTLNLIVVVLLMTSAVSAKSLDLEVTLKEKETIQLQLAIADEDARLLFKDINGKVLYKERLKNGRHETSLDLRIIPAGTYYVYLENESSIEKREIVKTAEGLKIKEASEIIFKPDYKIEKDIVRVFFNNINETHTSLEIYDNNGRLVGTSSTKEREFRKTFDFSEMPAGEYRINIKSGENFFTKSVNFR